MRDAGDPRPLIVIGAGGHGRETLDVIEALAARGDAAPAYTFLGFAADGADEDLLARRGATLLGPSGAAAELLEAHDAWYHVAIGSPRTRAAIDDALVDAGFGARAATLVHPSATIGSDDRLGPGAYLAPGARITTNVTLGRHAQLNVNAVVSHDVVAGDHLTLSPGALVNGTVALGDRVFLGTGAVVLPGRTIGDEAVIAAGAVVTGDVPAGVTARGVPARW